MTRLLSTDEAAELLGLKPSTLTTWRSRRRSEGPPFLKLGVLVKYDPRDLQAWLARQRVGATDDRPA